MFKFPKTSELSFIPTQALPAQIICSLEWYYMPINPEHNYAKMVKIVRNKQKTSKLHSSLRHGVIIFKFLKTSELSLLYT